MERLKKNNPSLLIEVCRQFVRAPVRMYISFLLNKKRVSNYFSFSDAECLLPAHMIALAGVLMLDFTES